MYWGVSGLSTFSRLVVNSSSSGSPVFGAVSERIKLLFLALRFTRINRVVLVSDFVSSRRFWSSGLGRMLAESAITEKCRV